MVWLKHREDFELFGHNFCIAESRIRLWPTTL